MKYCPNCGQEMDDNTKFCGACGTKVDEVQAQAAAPAPESAPVQSEPVFDSSAAAADTVSAAAYADPQPSASASPEKKGGFKLDDKVKKLAIIIGAAVVALVVIVLACSLLLGGGYKKPIKKYISLLNSREENYYEFFKLNSPSFDYKAQMELLKLANEIGDKDEVEENEEYLEEIMKDHYDEIEDEFGKNWKYTFKVTEVDELSNKELKAYRETLKSQGDTYKESAEYYEEDAIFYGEELNKSNAKKVQSIYKELGSKYKEADVKKGYEVEIEYTIKGKDDKDTDDVTFKVYKVNNEWIIDDMPF
ncbi:MAG: zinc ribbon domain-containing protein [Lachnospiraceae bacterium]|nr:zinc ribbon domain-containing protein [Lachnospiraceae bacterium]